MEENILKTVEVGGGKKATDRQGFNLTDKEAIALAEDLLKLVHSPEGQLYIIDLPKYASGTTITTEEGQEERRAIYVMT